MNVRYLVCGVLVFSTPLVGAKTGERLTMRVSPVVAFAPAYLVVQTRIEASDQNRSIEIIAESGEFYRSSEMPLNGDQAPRSSRFEFRGLPGGRYTVAAVLKGTSEVLALAHQEINVVESPKGR
jgi:hypothetical protein